MKWDSEIFKVVKSYLELASSSEGTLSFKGGKEGRGEFWGLERGHIFQSSPHPTNHLGCFALGPPQIRIRVAGALTNGSALPRRTAVRSRPLKDQHPTHNPGTES